jgi:hypothetical protein
MAHLLTGRLAETSVLYVNQRVKQTVGGGSLGYTVRKGVELPKVVPLAYNPVILRLAPASIVDIFHGMGAIWSEIDVEILMDAAAQTIWSASSPV